MARKRKLPAATEKVPTRLTAQVIADQLISDQPEYIAELNKRFSRKKATAILALQEGYSKVKAARLAKVSEKTIHEWLKDPEFADEIANRNLQILNFTNLRLMEIALSNQPSNAVACFNLKATVAPESDIRWMLKKQDHEMKKELIALEMQRLQQVVEALPKVVLGNDLAPAEKQLLEELLQSEESDSDPEKPQLH